MLICRKCGASNPLGRVFCTNCGGKLDTSSVTSEDVAAQQREGLFARHWKKLLYIPLILVVVVVALALWPHAPTIGQKGTPVGGRRAKVQLETLRELADGRSMTVTLTERDVNAYIEYCLADSLRADALSIAVREGYFGVRMTRAMKARQIGSFRIVPRFSYDALFVPAGGTVVARKAAIGHLPLWGPFRNMAVKTIYGVVSTQNEWANLRHATKFEVGGGKIAIHARK